MEKYAQDMHLCTRTVQSRLSGLFISPASRIFWRSQFQTKFCCKPGNFIFKQEGFQRFRQYQNYFSSLQKNTVYFDIQKYKICKNCEWLCVMK